MKPFLLPPATTPPGPAQGFRPNEVRYRAACPCGADAWWTTRRERSQLGFDRAVVAVHCACAGHRGGGGR